MKCALVQVRERQERTMCLREQEARENLLMRQQMLEENEREKALKTKKLQHNKAMLQQVQAENILKLKEKAKMEEMRKEEEKRHELQLYPFLSIYHQSPSAK